MPKRVSVQITADSSGFDATVSGMAGKTRRSADEIKAAAAQAIGSVSALTAANSRLVTAQARVADAAGAVRAAEARLAQVRGRARSTTLQNATAEEALAKAHRASILAQRDLASAQDKGSLAKRLGTTEVQSAGRAISVAGLAIGAGVALAVRASANFEQAMSGVASTGHYTSGQLDLLSKAAIAGGQATQFSATEAAQGEAELVKAGLSVQNVLGGGLTGALNLAAAGNLSVADAASAAATAINQFGLQGADATHVADRFVQIAGVAQGETSDVAEAFKNGAVSASQYGLSIDDASDVTAAFAKNGVVGAQAGTLMRSALTNLYAPTNSVQKALDKLGVSAYDAAGNALPIADVAGQLHDKLAPLNEDAKNNALARIFGKETLQGGAILAKEGAAGLGAIRAELDAFPTAAQTAATKMDNLKGDIEQLSGSLETGLIKTGSGANGFLRDLAQGATKAVNEFTDLPAAVQKGALGFGVLASGGLLAAGGLIKLVSAATTAKVALDTLSISGSRVPGALGAIGKAAGVTVAAFALLQGIGRGSNALFGGVTTSLGDAGQAIAGLGKNAAGASSDINKFFTFSSKQDLNFLSDGVSGLGDAFAVVTQNAGTLPKVLNGISSALGFTTEASQVTDRFSQLDQTLTQMGTTSAPQAAAGFAAIAKTAAAQKVPLDQLVALFPQYKQQLQDQATALGVTVPDSAQVYADWMGGKVPAAVLAAAQANPKAAASFGVVAAAADQSAKGFATAQDALKNLINPQKISGQAAQDLSTKLFGSAQAAIAASNAQIAYAQAVRQAKASTGGGIDPKTDKGASNLSLLNQQASAYQQVASAQIAAGKSAGTVSAGTQKARDSFIANAEAMGVNSGKAKDLADKYGLIPKNVKVKIEEQVQKNAEDELTKLKALDGTIITPKIQALIDQGKYKQALSALKDVQKDRRAKVKAEADTKGAEGKLKSAAKTRQAALKAQAQGVEAESGKLNRAARKRQAELAAKATGVSPAAAAFTRAAKKRQAEIKAQATGTGAANSAINAVAKPRTVNIHVVTTKSTRVADNDKGATGGMFTPAGFIMRRSMGGPVWGAGTATSDSIPALLSNGEFVINAKSVKAIGADRLSYANREGVLPKFAGGGSVRALAEGGLAATTGKFQIADIYALIQAL
jgi:TP901 family phage tail tape measure protein